MLALLTNKTKMRTTAKITSWIKISIPAIFFTITALSLYLGKSPLDVLVFYVVASLLAFTLYAIDKSAAINGRWRISENKLHLVSLLGGWPGAMIAQQKLRHKSVKQKFLFVFWVTVILNSAAFS